VKTYFYGTAGKNANELLVCSKPIKRDRSAGEGLPPKSGPEPDAHHTRMFSSKLVS